MKSALLVLIILLLLLGGVFIAKTKMLDKSNSPVMKQQQIEVKDDVQNISVDEREPTVAEIPLTIEEPSDNLTTQIQTITVKGLTLPGATVYVNEIEMSADANGTFSTAVQLDEGENYVMIVAHDNEGNYAEKELIITYSPQ